MLLIPGILSLDERCAAMITVQDLADGAADRPLLATDGVVDAPLLIVDLDRPVSAATIDRARTRIAASDRLLVGVRRGQGSSHNAVFDLIDGLDATIVGSDSDDRRIICAADPDQCLSTLSEAVKRNTHAALILGQVLRLADDLPIAHAIDIESLAYSTLLGGPGFRRWLHERGPRPMPPPARQEPVLMRRDGSRLRITLNRPERRNAYGAEVRDGLVEGLRLAAHDPSITTIVLDGAGPSFSAGGDLDEFGTTPDLATAHLIRTRAGAARSMAQLADKIEARVHGTCVGAGIEVPAFADRVIATPEAMFRLPELSMGLIPGAGGCVSIPRRIGRWRTFWLCTTGSTLDAPTALAWGLIDRITYSYS